MAEKSRNWKAVLDTLHQSDRLNRVSEGAEVLYRRLLEVCDNGGNYFADPGLVLGYVFAHRMSMGLTPKDILDRTQELVTVGLVDVYAEGKLLHISRYYTRLRSDGHGADIRFASFPGNPGPTPDSDRTPPGVHPVSTDQSRGEGEKRETRSSEYERQKGYRTKLHPKVTPQKSEVRSQKSEGQKTEDLGIGGDGQKPTPPDKNSSASPSNPKAEENDRAVKVRNWFAVCYRKINRTDLPGFDPDDRRMSVQDRNACKAIYAMYGNDRAGKPGYVNQEELRRRLYHALAGNYYKLRPPANIAEFKRILPNCVNSALRPDDQRKSIPHVPARPKVNETPGAERKRYADPDPWEEIPE